MGTGLFPILSLLFFFAGAFLAVLRFGRFMQFLKQRKRARWEALTNGGRKRPGFEGVGYLWDDSDLEDAVVRHEKAKAKKFLLLCWAFDGVAAISLLIWAIGG